LIERFVEVIFSGVFYESGEAA